MLFRVTLARPAHPAEPVDVVRATGAPPPGRTIPGAGVFTGWRARAVFSPARARSISPRAPLPERGARFFHSPANRKMTSE